MPYAIAPDGTQLNFRTDGPEDAPALLMSNSLGTSLEVWSRQTPALGGFRVVRYDGRGHGGSDAPAGEYSLDQLGRDALAVLDAAGVRRTHALGLSMGGAVCQWLALNAPERIDRLVLANTAASFGAPEVWAARMETARTEGTAALVDTILERWFTPAFREREPAEVARIRGLVLGTPGVGYAGCCAALRDIDLRSALSRIACPTLVIAGEHDTSTPLDRAEELKGSIPGARLEVLPAAHLSAVECADAFNAAVHSFLGQA